MSVKPLVRPFHLPSLPRRNDDQTVSKISELLDTLYRTWNRRDNFYPVCLPEFFDFTERLLWGSPEWILQVDGSGPGQGSRRTSAYLPVMIVYALATVEYEVHKIHRFHAQ